MVRVLLPLLYTGTAAGLMFGTTSGTTPFTVQYSGRQLWSMKLKALYTELLAEGMTGMIQFGVAPGAIAQVIVPAFFLAPAAAIGMDPMPPGTLTTLEPPLPLLPPPPLEPLLLQAASAVTLATARARPATFLLRNIICPPSSRCSRL